MGMENKVQTSGVIPLYHGNDHILPEPLYGFGKKDNDYGSGFYTTSLIEKAEDWAVSYGTNTAIVNKYELNLDEMKILNLDDYGILSWIAEIIYNRGTRGEDAAILGEQIIKKYKIDTEGENEPDIIIGYRADDSYSDIIDAFLQNKLNIEETERLFKEGDLGYQYFIKSKKAFESLKFTGYDEIINKEISPAEIYARNKVSSFLRQRNSAILVNNFIPNGIIARVAATSFYEYNKDWKYYNLSSSGNINDLISNIKQDIGE